MCRQLINSKKIQYIIIIWILLLKLLEILSKISLDVDFLSYLSILGFQNISNKLYKLWNVIVIMILILLFYRIMKDVFNIFDIKYKRKLYVTLNIFICIFSSSLFYFQLAHILTIPNLDPHIELNTMISLKSPEILGWYWIDWGEDYYYKDFRRVKEMNIDGVILVSSNHHFLLEPEAFFKAIKIAHEFDLKVGIVVFHPYDKLHQECWGLPVHQDKFADFANITWINRVYLPKLIKLVSIGESINVTYYVYDEMTFDMSSNLTIAQYFIDLTLQLTKGKALMLAGYPPEKSLAPYLHIKMKNWDWYTAPEWADAIEASYNARPLNCSSIGQFLWLHKRTRINFNTITKTYNLLKKFNRIQIFALRYGAPHWEDGKENSILEHPPLITHITKLNRMIKKKKMSDIYVPPGSSLKIDLTRSIFTNIYNKFEYHEINEYATKQQYLSSFRYIKKSENKKVIEIVYYGNGSDGIQGWFSYRTKLCKPIKINVNTTLIILFNFLPSYDKTGWLAILLKFEEGKYDYKLLKFIFKEKAGNYHYLTDNGTMGVYEIGNSTGFKLYQLNLYDLYFMSFSKIPYKITEIWYEIGGEADNTIKAEFYYVKISKNPFMINNNIITKTKLNINSKSANTLINIDGVNISRLYISYNVLPTTKKIRYLIWFYKIIKIENYKWNLDNYLNYSILKSKIMFRKNITNKHKIYINNKNVKIEDINKGICFRKNDLKYLNLIIINEFYTPFIIISLISTMLILILPLYSHIISIYKKIMK